MSNLPLDLQIVEIEKTNSRKLLELLEKMNKVLDKIKQRKEKTL